MVEQRPTLDGLKPEIGLDMALRHKRQNRH
jgi:hypothetical protein